MADTVSIQGHADGRFVGVADAFRTSLSGDDLGAAVCVVRDGMVVVDLWTGVRDGSSRAPWLRATPVPLFSTGKGPVALAALLSVARGDIALDEPVAARWPAFAANGKAGITLRHILDHSSGLVLFGRRMDRRMLADPVTVAAILEAMTPCWAPGTHWGYQIGTFGELIGEILCRADPRRRPFDTLFAETVAAPLAIDLRYGVRSGEDFARLAHVRLPTARQWASGLSRAPLGLWRPALWPRSLLHRAGREMRDLDVNDPGWMRLPFPSANAAGTPRDLAMLYAAVAAGGGRIGLTPALFEDLTAPPQVPPGGARDRVMGIPGRWRLGFVRPGPVFPFSPSPRAFGMPGLGGSFAYADPDEGIGYAFAPNRLGVLPFDDSRERVVRAAVQAAIRRR